MNKKVYKLIVTVCMVLGIGAALIYDPDSKLSWVVVCVAIVVGVISAGAYFSYYVMDVGGGDVVNADEGALVLPEDESVLLARVEERPNVEKGADRRTEFVVAEALLRRPLLDWKVGEVGALTPYYGIPRKHKTSTGEEFVVEPSVGSSEELARALDRVLVQEFLVNLTKALDDASADPIVKLAGGEASSTKRRRYKHVMRQEDLWHSAYRQDDRVEERSKKRLLH